MLISIPAFQAFAQEPTIQLGPDEIGENQTFTITVTVKNERLKNYSDFPEIPGFRKRGTSSASSTNIVNGQISSSQSITMSYSPIGQGSYRLEPFSMTINGQKVNSPGTTIRVTEAKRQQRRGPGSIFNRNPFDDDVDDEPEFIEVEDDAFLALTTSKNEVYLGEGFNTSLSFYVAEDNQAPLQFHQLGQQLSEILKKLRPANCWEENFNIENVNGEPVTLNGKRYTQYTVYQATFFPLNTEPVEFPSVELEMIKYRVAKNPSFFGRNRQEDYKLFKSKPKTVTVKDLPPHPMKDEVAVGDYELEEKISTNEFQTGNSFTYQFTVFGRGNIAAIDNQPLKTDEYFEFYNPNVSQNIYRQDNRVTGSKSFTYYLIPKEPGVYDLGKYFSWVFFNPRTARYDTLKSELSINVVGESLKNDVIQANDLGNFYNRIGLGNNQLKKIGQPTWFNLGVNAFILLLLGASVFIIFKKI